ncbi:MAG: glycosyltransferase family 4 protein [Paludibacteraceae bacterium]|nr:glycosyltransferase family 4 protein [Paludibacteraceae bacterium]
MKKNNVLFILPFLPYPLISGGHQAIYNGILAAKEYANVFIVYKLPTFRDVDCENRKKLEAVLPSVKLFCYKPTFVEKIKTRIYSRLIIFAEKYFHGINKYFRYRSVGYNVQEKGYVDYVNKLINKYDIDVVQVEMCSVLSMVLSLPHSVKKVFVHHELRFERDFLQLTLCNAPKQMFEQFEMNKMVEIGLLNRYNEIVVLSEDDRKKLQREGVKTPILTSFAVVKTPQYDVSIDFDGKSLVFVGPEYHTPNKDGLVWFLQHCWDKLLMKDNAYRLRIVGKWSEKTKKQWTREYKNIHFMGFVDDLYSVINDAIMIVPVRVGSGIRMKILEAGIAGVPVVSTTVGAEGLQLVSGKHILIADLADEFVLAVEKLKNSKDERRKIGENLKGVVSKNYSFNALCENRKPIYTGL